MPLLCSSVLALLLLPLSLSCDTKRSPQGLRDDYVIVQVHLVNARDGVTTSLQNSTCQELKHKLRRCASRNNTDFVGTLYKLACKMKDLSLPHTSGLTSSLLSSIRCRCLVKPTTESISRSRMTTTASRRRGNGLRKIQREVRKLCRAQAYLGAVAECYQMLNDRGA